LDDQEFVVAFESDKPEDFLDCVMDLRESEMRKFTLRDTPIFTCVQKTPREMLDILG
jgi:chlorite dismutase